MAVTYQMTFPEEILGILRWRKADIERSIKQELAIHFFRMERLSFGQARRLAELSVVDFLDVLKERKIPLHYDLADYEDDLNTMKELA